MGGYTGILLPGIYYLGPSVHGGQPLVEGGGGVVEVPLDVQLLFLLGPRKHFIKIKTLDKVMVKQKMFFEIVISAKSSL